MCFGGDSKPKEPSYPLPNGSQSPVYNNWPAGQAPPQTALAAETANPSAEGRSASMGRTLGAGQPAGQALGYNEGYR